MDIITAALFGPVIVAASCAGEYLKLVLTKTDLDRQSVYTGEMKLCLISIVVLVPVAIYKAVRGEALDYPATGLAFIAGAYFGALLWKAKMDGRL